MDLISRDVFLRHTDKVGKRTVRDYRVYDMSAFIAAREKDAADEKGKVEVITEKQFKAERAA